MTNSETMGRPVISAVTGQMDEVRGFQVAGVAAGLKANGALDVALIVSDRPCVAAAMFTVNTVKAAPVLVDQAVLAANPAGIRAVAVNTRCANASTGAQGIANARAMAGLAADALGVPVESVFVMSTGVIGTQLPMDKIAHGITLAAAALGQDWDAAARAIMTTDTRPKSASVTVKTSTGSYTLSGIAKGSGMIAPNMATMLSVIVTDAALSPEQASTLLNAAVEPTFNRIVVDGDMSTNDTVLLLANGASGVTLGNAEDEAYFLIALTALAKQLAQAIVRDGEGATKFITLRVTGAANDAEAQQLANAIATSPLVKTAFYGGDANWGRIIAVAGRSGIAFNPDTANLWIAVGEEAMDELHLFALGVPTAYSEARATEIMGAPSITAHLDCGMGSGSSVVWTCDLSHDYVSINGHYRS